ncbi:uncharacterized protein LOC123543599 isoform X2 [Mercenaria mercenaria]|uniref:uncharacterized protein LOC123543599 isoform X2 n=1 Tax=Mercenaria mercenaria TaxID=6596 RepID=UPI00234ED661|nr:uncharacterized protein LOC123543599 isoform X2 [Mercenaria mercenaria]
MMELKALMVLAVLSFTYGEIRPEKKILPFVSRTYSSRFSGDVKEVLKIPPAPMPGFNLLPWLGPWFYQYHKAPCSWAVSEEFTDYTQITELEGTNVINHDTMRNRGVCNSVTSIMSVTGPGEFTGKDLVGNNWSGTLIVVATDYKSFSISWGCTKMSVFDNRCEDPYAYVKTRQRKPPARVLRRIEMILRDIWGISVRQLTRILHGRPCSSGRKKIG